MVFRSNKPARPAKARTNLNVNTETDGHDKANLKTSPRGSIQVLSHQQLVTRQHRKWTDYSSHTSANVDFCTRQKSTHTRAASASALSQNAAAMKSSLSVNKMVSNLESRIDMGQAISLLQELKKTASPEELVALHRALLPVKEDTPPLSPTCPQLPPIGEHAYTSAPSTRAKSTMLPGLATRSSMFDDALRKPSDPSAPEVQPKETWRLDWPDRISDGKSSPTRAGTPNDHDWHAGAFQAGTLRITNDAASPEPSMITKSAEPQCPEVVKEEDLMDGASKSVSTLASTVIDDDRPDRSSDTQISDPTANRENGQPETPCPQRERPESDGGILSSDSAMREQLLLDRPLQRHSFHTPQTATTLERAPRFQQRWDHRASHLSQEYIIDCELTASPPEERNGLFDFASRLSTVMDDENEDDENAAEKENRGIAHARTLSKLTGERDGAEVGDGQEHGAARTSGDQLPPPAMQIATRAHVVRKMDSGYCSDDLGHVLQHQDSAETACNRRPTIAPDEAPTFSAQDQSRTRRREVGGQSTYDGLINTSPTSDSGPGSSPANGTKKTTPLSLFKSKPRRQSFKVLNVDPGTDRAANAPARMQYFESSTDTDTARVEVRKKKLRKPMPESVRYKRKKTVGNLRDLAESQEADTGLQSSDTTPENLSPSCMPEEQSRPSTATIRSQAGSIPQTGDDDVSKSSSSAAPSNGWLRKRGKSFGRKRSKTLDESCSEASPPMQDQSAPVRKRSKSLKDVTSNEEASKTANVSDAQAPSDEGAPTMQHHSQGSPRTPEHSSFASVARALNSHPPSPQKPSHSLTEPIRSSTEPQSRPKDLLKRYYSVHRLHDEEPHTDRSDGRPENSSPEPGAKPPPPPAHAKQKRSQPTTSLTSVAVGSSCSVEERFPGWQGKPALQTTVSDLPWLSRSTQNSQPSRSRTFAEGVPPLPELPPDIATKVSRADEVVAKKLRTSPRSSPLTSARSSIDSGDTRKATVIRNAARREQEARVAKENRMATLERLSSPRTDGLEAPLSQPGHVQRWSIDGTIQMPHPEDQAVPASPTHDSQHPGWPSWDKQSNLWRQRRQALVEPCSESTRKTSSASGEEDSPASPAIVVSRYITPLGAENVYLANKVGQTNSQANSAEKLAQSYGELIISEKENCPIQADSRRADSVVSAATFVTVSSADERPAQYDVPRTGSAVSTYTTTTTTTVSTSRPSDKGSAPPPYGRSKSFYAAYRPADSARAERSRALSLARRSYHASKESLNPPERPELKQRTSEDLFDRYSGGLNFGWDRDTGFGGSAGMRSFTSLDMESVKRKSVKMSEEFGLDLSDVPVFLRKV
ncbi:Hypothetical predicted protein [Lecanosticta acicola]|uniref:Uncharacterized protein n=1 Tax=Lecanosticta acicola TaxID=111012 RepID=A0AAI8Z0G0_9PEZI|nr:Hypothetical predicted protein [Lecanosticta acicola]